MASPRNILMRLEELKNWQIKQQERLLLQHEEALQNFNTSKPIQSVPVQGADFSNQKIGGSKTPQNVDIPVARKQPYLRKGSGLRRYGLDPGDQHRRFLNGPKRKPANENEIIETNGEKPKLHNLEVPNLKWEKAQPISPEKHNLECTVSLATRNIVEQINLLASQQNAHNNSEPSYVSTNTENDLMVFEALERRVLESSFCSTDSSILGMLSNKPIRSPENLIAESLDESVEESLSHSSGDSIVSEDILNQPFDNEATLMDKGFADACTMTDSDGTNEENVLADKLLELEKEICNFRSENAKIQTLKINLEQHKAGLEQEYREKKEQLEKNVHQSILEVENVKAQLSKEKITFSKQLKDLQNKPNRKEREEISMLKAEVENLKETLKLKDTRNATTQARLRNQIKSLEKDVALAKEEIEQLNKTNSKLTAAQRVNKKQDTKMLHEINKNLSKLAKDVLESQKNSSQSECDFKIPPTDKQKDATKLSTTNNIQQSQLKQNENGQCATLEDGSEEVKYDNGSIKTVSPDGNIIRIKYHNGDEKETDLAQGSVRYYYSQDKILQITYNGGLEVTQFSNGQVEKKYPNGKMEIIYPDKTVRIIDNDLETVKYEDGTIITVRSNGERVLRLANGQIEFHNDSHKRREYPDGTVKLLYSDGTQETRYSSGRIRIKDAQGHLVLDTVLEGQ